MPTENLKGGLWAKFEYFSKILWKSLKKLHNTNLCFHDKGGEGALRKTRMAMLCQLHIAGLLKQ